MSDRLNLPDRWRRELEALLQEHVPDAEVWAYGSRVNGMAHEASDLDLVLRGPNLERIPTLQFSDLKEDLQESSIPILVDIHDWARIPKSFHNVIASDYEVMQQADLSDRWHTFKLSEVASINSATYSLNESWPYVNYLDTANITENRIADIQHFSLNIDGLPSRARRKAQRGDIVYSTVRPNQHHHGILREVPPNFLVSTGFAVIRTDTAVADPDYLYWYLTQPSLVEYFQMLAEHSTSAYPSIKPSDLTELEISLPPLKEQCRIAAVLRSLDDRIELNRRMCETLESMAQALFKSWFVDFDPVRAKMEGRHTGLPDHIADLFPDRLVPSELGSIPDGWCVKSLSGIATFVNGLAMQKYPPRTGSRLPVLKIAQLRAGHLKNSDFVHDEIDRKYVVDNGDIVFSWSGSLECRYWTGGQAALNQHLFRVVPSSHPKWLCYLATLKHLAFFREIAADKATTMGHIQRHHLDEALVAVPPDVSLGRFDAILDPLMRQAVQTGVRARGLARTRDALLPRLVTSELIVSEPDLELEAVVG